MIAEIAVYKLHKNKSGLEILWSKRLSSVQAEKNPKQIWICKLLINSIQNKIPLKVESISYSLWQCVVSHLAHTLILRTWGLRTCGQDFTGFSCAEWAWRFSLKSGFAHCQTQISDASGSRLRHSYTCLLDLRIAANSMGGGVRGGHWSCMQVDELYTI